MMIKKKLGVLAGAVLLASTAQAAFDQGDAVLYAWDSTNDDTYFVDLGVTAADLGSAVVNITDAGLAAWLGTHSGAQWTILGTQNDATPVGGPPAIGKSVLNTGVVSTSTSGVAVAATSGDAIVQAAAINVLIADAQAESGGLTSFEQLGTDPAAANSSDASAGFTNSLNAFGASASIFYNQASPADGAQQSAASVTTQLGAINNATVTGGLIQVNFSEVVVPVPAAAWLFGSALAGLTVVRRRK